MFLTIYLQETFLSMTSTLNPNAKEFIPFHTLNPCAKEFIPFTTYNTSEMVEIPKITCYDDLQQVAQIAYSNLNSKPSYFELYWNGKHAILDTHNSSLQFPDMTIRNILRYYFDDTPFEFAQDDAALDEPASNAPAIAVNIIPLYE